MTTMAHVSSAKFQCWRTPGALAAALVAEFALLLDVAAEATNAVCAWFLDERADGLTYPWDRAVWCNPPYEDVRSWLDKAYMDVILLGSCPRAVFLVPAAVGVSWFTWACTWAEIHTFDERIRFELPPRDELPEEFRDKLYTEDGKPKTSPGGGNALIIVERGRPVGITAMRSAKTGEIVRRYGAAERIAA